MRPGRKSLGLRVLLLSLLLTFGGLAVPTASAEPAPLGVPTTLAGVHLHKLGSNSCLVARVGAGDRPVQQTPCAGFSDQNWGFIQWVRDGVYVNQIYNLDRNLCIVARGAVETPAVATTCNAGFADQLWWAYEYPNGSWRFQNVNSGGCLVARNNSQATHTVCAQFSDQFWWLD
jgi:hypothetical protein